MYGNDTVKWKKYCYLTANKSSSCKLKSFQLYNFPWASEFEVSSSLAKAFSRLSSRYENSESTSGCPCKLKQILVDFLSALNLGKFLSGCWNFFPENTAKTFSLFKMAAWTSREGRYAVHFQIWSVRYFSGYLSCTDDRYWGLPDHIWAQ